MNLSPHSTPAGASLGSLRALGVSMSWLMLKAELFYHPDVTYVSHCLRVLVHGPCQETAEPLWKSWLLPDVLVTPVAM